MAEADEKILDKVAKLLRLAAPGSNAPESERASAALEAARLIEKHDINLHTLDTMRKRAQEEGQIRYGVWVLTVALDRVGCAACHKIISPRDHAWVRIFESGNKEFRHNYGPCRPAAKR